jgi:hypothetical protein
MRIWSLHSKYLGTKGWVTLWLKTLLAKMYWKVTESAIKLNNNNSTSFIFEIKP